MLKKNELLSNKKIVREMLDEIFINKNLNITINGFDNKVAILLMQEGFLRKDISDIFIKYRQYAGGVWEDESEYEVIIVEVINGRRYRNKFILKREFINKFLGRYYED